MKTPLKIAAPIALAVLTAASAAALARDKDRGPPPADWMSVSDVAAKLAAQGLKVVEIEADDGLYEAKWFDGEGRRFKAKIHPRTGEIISQWQR